MLVTLLVPVVVLDVFVPALVLPEIIVLLALEPSVVAVFTFVLVLVAGTVIPFITVEFVAVLFAVAAESLSRWLMRSLTLAD